MHVLVYRIVLLLPASTLESTLYSRVCILCILVCIQARRASRPPGPDALPHPTRKKPGGCVWEGGGIPEADYIIIIIIQARTPLYTTYCHLVLESRTCIYTTRVARMHTTNTSSY